MRELFIQATYLAASVLFILGLKSLSRPDQARRGMRLALLGMAFAVVGTLVNHEIVRYEWIAGGLVLGAVIGYPLGMWVPMTALPQRIAIAQMFGATAATLVGVAEYLHRGAGLAMATMAALGFEVMFGSITIAGGFMAFAKLQELITGRPVTFPGQNAFNLALLAATAGILVYLVGHPALATLF